MTLDSFFRDIYSQLNLDNSAHSIYAQDIIKALNDSIRNQRREYIEKGYGVEFSETEILYSLNENFEYPFLNSAYLSGNIMDSISIDRAILNVIGYETSNELSDELQTFSKGDIAIKGNSIYKCLTSFTDTNTYSLIIPKGEIVRDFYPGNGLAYHEGEYIHDIKNDKFYYVNSDYEANTDDEASTIAEFDEYFWIEQGRTYIHVAKYPFYAVSYLSVFDNMDSSEAVTIKKNELFATKGLKKVIITYIPEWKEVTEYDDTIDIPDFMIPKVKAESVNKMKIKLYGQMNPTPTNESIDE